MEFGNETELKENKSSIKLIKNSRGYNWEIKVYDDDDNLLFSLPNKVAKLDEDLRKALGDKLYE